MTSSMFESGPSTLIISEPAVAAEYLRSHLGCNIDMFGRCVQAGVADASMTTANSPQTAFGSRFWEGVIRQARDELAPADWTVDRPGQLEVVRRPDNRLQLTACLGDEGTGDPTIDPSCEHPRGVATAEAIKTNELTFADMFPDDPSWRPMETWWLLYRIRGVDPSRVVAEVSLPIAMSGKKVSGWAVRVMLPEIPFGPTALLHLPEPAVDPLVTLKRRVG